MNKAVFTIDNIAEAYIGYTDGTLWNGWSTPYFEKSEALALMNNYNKNGDADFRITFDPIEYTFTLYAGEPEPSDWWQGHAYHTEEGVKWLYGIGAYSWVWDKESVRPVARQIKWLFADYDKEAEMEELKTKLQNHEILKQAIMILRSDKDAETQIKELEAIL